MAVVGLDIEGDYVTMVEMKETGKEPILFNYATSRISAVERADPDSMARLLTRLISEKNMTSREVVSFIGGQEVFVKFISLPQMPRDDLRQSIWWEAERSAPFSLQDALFDYHILKEVIFEDGTKKVDVLVVAAPRDVVNRHVDLLKRARLNPTVVTVKPIAVAGALRNAIALSAQKCVAVVDIGSTTTTLIVLKEGHISFIREIRVGDKDITRSICEGLGVDETQGEILKRRHGCALQEEEARLLAIAVREELDHIKDSISFWEDIRDEVTGKVQLAQPGLAQPEAQETKQVNVATRHILEKLLGEFDRSLGFWRQQAPEDNVSLLILSGKGAELRDFDKLVAARMQLEVQLANPVAALKMGSPLIDKDELRAVAPRLTAAVGLGQKSVVSMTNLLPGHLKRVVARRSMEELGRLSPRQIAAALIVALAALFVVMHTAGARYESDVNAIDRQLANLESLFEQAREKKAETQKMREEINAIRRLKEQQLLWFDILRELSLSVIPDKLWLKKAVFVKTRDIKGGPRFELRVSGLAFSHAHVTKFVLRLDRFPYFQRVRLENSLEASHGDEKLVTFTVTCLVRKEGKE